MYIFVSNITGKLYRLFIFHKCPLIGTLTSTTKVLTIFSGEEGDKPEGDKSVGNAF